MVLEVRQDLGWMNSKIDLCHMFDPMPQNLLSGLQSENMTCWFGIKTNHTYTPLPVHLDYACRKYPAS